MTDRIRYLRGEYHDSVTLMLATRDAQALPGVQVALALAATPVNRAILAEQGFLLDDTLEPNDVILAFRAEADHALVAAGEAVEARLRGPGAGDRGETGISAPRSVRSAARRDPTLNLAIVSVPGRYAAHEVSEAIASGLHVFCFSSGVPVEIEAALKRRALARGLLLMGPDCGTAIVDGMGLGFSNAVARGPVGIVGASGTGIQEVTCLLDGAKVGVSQAIGVGSHDLSAEVGGAMTLRGLEVLAEDQDTQAVVVISKPPNPEVAERVTAAAGAIGKPAVICFLASEPGSAVGVATLEEAARRAAALVGRDVPVEPIAWHGPITPGDIRGLFSGGSLCFETMAVVSGAVGPVASHTSLGSEGSSQDVGRSLGHRFVDFGDEELVEGRLHPMIDPSFRNSRFRAEATDPGVGVIVLDVVLGFAAHPDPAAELAPLIADTLSERGGSLTVVVSVCGAAGDPQEPEEQVAALREAGAVVTRGAAEAGRVALAAAGIGATAVGGDAS